MISTGYIPGYCPMFRIDKHDSMNGMTAQVGCILCVRRSCAFQPPKSSYIPLHFAFLIYLLYSSKIIRMLQWALSDFPCLFRGRRTFWSPKAVVLVALWPSDSLNVTSSVNGSLEVLALRAWLIQPIHSERGYGHHFKTT